MTRSVEPWRSHAERRNEERMNAISTALLFVATAVAEILGCYLPYLWLKKNGSPWLLIPALASLAIFAWLLTLPAAGLVAAALYYPVSWIF